MDSFQYLKRNLLASPDIASATSIREVFHESTSRGSRSLSLARTLMGCCSGLQADNNRKKNCRPTSQPKDVSAVFRIR